MNEPTFEYCSIHYLNQWLTRDSVFYEVLCDKKAAENKHLKTLKQAGAFYRVARNLPTAIEVSMDKKRYEPVLSILNEVSLSTVNKSPVSQIIDTSNKISAQYKRKSALSLSSKFLWLKFRSPILIYDSQARKALNVKEGDIETYFYEWKNQFESNREKIEEVCNKLAALSLYAINQEIGTKDYIDTISQQPWFHERVFDIYLWSKGA